ncbi:IPT/TIG domain-containing protein [Krasilnikovia sp. M28-CT-15]|uniref:IPT/TIG domain-containing protein n=1 Tax=Krasilnikovia sp. M28-CT-15 TaxID=3373540 RepID=UPI0038769D77
MSRRVRILLLALLVSLGLVAPGFAGAAQAAAKRPVITKVGAGLGPLQPTRIVLRGKNLRGVKAVRFGKWSGVVVARSGATAVTVRTPRGVRAGTYSVQVRTAAGWSKLSTRARYRFVGAPALSRMSPASGNYTGGTRVTLIGRDLDTATRVTFGTQAATILARKTGSIVVRTPIGVLGATPVTITTKFGSTRGKGPAFTYVKPAEQSALQIQANAGTLVATTVDWVTGGYNAETGVAGPWQVGLPRGAAAPTVGQQFLLRPGSAAFPSGLVGTVSEVVDQLDETVRITVQPTDLEKAVDSLALDYSGSLPRPAGAVSTQGVDVGKAFEFSISGPNALSCQGSDGTNISFGADLTSTVTDVDVDQHFRMGSLWRKPSYDGAFTAELQTTGKITVSAAATCKIKAAWANAQRKIIPLGTSGATLSFGPSFEFKISGKGTWSIVDRTRTTFAVHAVLGSKPSYSRTSRSVESKQSGELTFQADVTGGVSVQLGLLDRAGLQAKVQLGISGTIKATTAPNVCVEAEVYAKLAVGVFLDAIVARWEADAFSAQLSIWKWSGCVLSEGPVFSQEPEITSYRLPDATIGTSYNAALTTADARAGTWTDINAALPAGLTLAADGTITGTPQAAVGDYPVLVDFKDAAGNVATATVRIRVLPRTSLGGGDIQVTLRWSGAADLDLHMLDPASEHIYYAHSTAASGGQLDHDANAGCNGIADDDNPVENVFWPTGGAPAGTYTVWVNTWSTCGAPLDWHLTVRRNGTVILDQTGTGTSPSYTFTLGTGVAANSLAARTVRTGPTPTGLPISPK